jgi:hypothetical protein
MRLSTEAVVWPTDTEPEGDGNAWLPPGSQ